jgi:hypothetical protein
VSKCYQHNNVSLLTKLRLGYINQFFANGPLSTVSCTWFGVPYFLRGVKLMAFRISNNVFGYTRDDGSNLGTALLGAIDTVRI